MNGYAFSGQVIRLKARDYASWKKTYAAIPDLDAELSSLDAYYATLPDKDRKNWFIRCSTALNKKHQEYLTKRPQVQERPKKLSVITGSMADMDPVKMMELFDQQKKAGTGG